MSLKLDFVNPQKILDVTRLFKYKLEYLRRYFPLTIPETLFGRK